MYFMTEIDSNKSFAQKEMINVLMRGTLEELNQYFVDSEVTQNELYSDLQFNINNAFKIAANNGDLEKCKYLLTSPDLNIHADIHFNNNSAMESACYWGYKDLVDYLFKSTELKENAKLPNNMEKIIESIIMHTKEARTLDQQIDYLCFIEYLVHDCLIRPTEKIISMLRKETHPSLYEPAIKQLAQNELYYSLQNDLQSNQNTLIKKIKI